MPVRSRRSFGLKRKSKKGPTKLLTFAEPREPYQQEMPQRIVAVTDTACRRPALAPERPGKPACKFRIACAAAFSDSEPDQAPLQLCSDVFLAQSAYAATFRRLADDASLFHRRLPRFRLDRMRRAGEAGKNLREIFRICTPSPGPSD
jgi:hypothetical protein